jgi:hypothetical protein
MGHPTVYPTGVTVHDPRLAFGGYTLFQAPGVGALLVDMNGREVQLWKGRQGFPNKLLRGGQVFGRPSCARTRSAIPGAAPPGRDRVVEVGGVVGYREEPDFCVISNDGTTR